MPTEPAVKRTVAYVDGQNLYHSAREAFGHRFPNFDPLALASRVCQSQGWNLNQTRFYTGVPDASDDSFYFLPLRKFFSLRARSSASKILS